MLCRPHRPFRFPGLVSGLLLLASVTVPQELATAQDQAVNQDQAVTQGHAGVLEHAEVPASDEGLPGTGTIRRYEWFQKLWVKKRAGWAADVEEDQGAVVFLGDSITQGWGPDLGGSFGELKVANRGISGDTTRGMLVRLEDDVLALRPRAVVLLMGTNDLEEGDSPESIAGNVGEIVDRIDARDPEVPIVLCKVFPSAASKRRPADAIQRINELQAEAVAGHEQVVVVDTWSIFADAEGNAKKAEFPDLLHPNDAGYAKWAEALRPVLAALRDADPLDVAEERLRAVYERGAFRGRAPRVGWLPDSSAYVLRGRTRVEIEDGAQRPLTEEEQRSLRADRLLSPDGGHRAESRGGRLSVRDLATGERTTLYESARREGVGLQNLQWSPDGELVLFTEVDRARVRVRNRILADDPSYPSVGKQVFARVGETIESLRVGVATVGGGAAVWLAVPSPERGFYLGQVEWAGNSEEILVEWLSRFRDERRFLLFDVATGEGRPLFEERDPAWVVASYGVNLGLEWVRGGDAFVVIHERDGWRHAYLHARDGKQLAQITKGDFEIIERALVDEAGGWFWFYAAPDDAPRKYLYRARLDGSSEAPERITPADQSGTHDYAIASDARFAVHTWSTYDQPPTIELVRLPSHEVVRVLEDNAELRDRVAKQGFRPTEFLQIPIAEDVSLDAWLMKPPGFDPARKYPVLVYVYSEPHAQTVLDEWGAAQSAYHRVVTDLGYLVLSIDGRGTPAPKGAAWRRAVFGSLGPLSTADQAKALETLAAERSYVDLDRVGIWGWSGGGSNTLNAMFRRPDLYDVGIAVAAKPQPHLYNAWFQEIYMRDREVNPEGYARSAPIHFAEGLEGDLLIIHGTGELNTHVQIIEGLVDRLIALGKRFDYFSYPHRRHGIREGDGTTVHMRSLMIRYLLDHLPPGPR